jgi:hypothetical protein
LARVRTAGAPSKVMLVSWLRAPLTEYPPPVS